MVLDSLMPGTHAAEDLSAFKSFKTEGIESDNGDAKKAPKNFRRRIGSRSDEKSRDPLKKKRSQVKKEVKLIKNGLLGQLAEKIDAGGSRGVKRAPHGSISVIGRRREMEDAVAVELGFLEKGGKSYNFFGVYDGHSGWRVSHACSEMLHKLLVKIVEDDIGEEIAWEKVMTAGLKKMDEEVNKNGEAVETTGSTAVVAVIGEDAVVVANCGDSRAVLSRGGVAVQVSDDHKPDRPDELERIEACGGKVINWNGHRVLGVLATSRSIGDQYLRPFVIADPEVKIINRTKSDEFLILASDGVWDVVSNDLACQVVRRCLDGKMRSSLSLGENVRVDITHDAAAALAEVAMAKGSHDNISVIVVDLKYTSSYQTDGFSC